MIRRPAVHGALVAVVAGLVAAACTSESAAVKREGAGGVRVPGAAPDFDAVRPGDRISIEPATGPAWPAVVGWARRTAEEQAMGGTLDGGGAFWLVRREGKIAGIVRPAGQGVIALGPEFGGLGEPSPPLSDVDGPCGVGAPKVRPVPSPTTHPPIKFPPVPRPPRTVGPIGFMKTATIRVAFMLTPRARAVLPTDPTDLDLALSPALAGARTCMGNSGIDFVEFEYAGVTCYPYTAHDVDGDGAADAESVDVIRRDVEANDSYGPRALRAFRDEAKADVVCIVTGKDPVLAGFAPVIACWGTAPPDCIAARAWIVMSAESLPAQTFAHEVAHVLGCGHQRGADVPEPTTQDCFSHGWTWGGDGSRVATVECQTAGANVNVVIPAYSTPQKSYAGNPIGQAPADDVCTGGTGADSATTIRFTAPLLANVR